VRFACAVASAVASAALALTLGSPVPAAGGLPTSPGTRVSTTVGLAPGVADQGWGITLPPGKTPMATGYVWGPDQVATNWGGLPPPRGVVFRSTNARLIPVNPRAGYCWRVYMHVDAAADADPAAQVTLWVIYL
jgi:hypothetical protein